LSRPPKLKSSRPAKAQKNSGGKASKATRRAVNLWRDARGRFARPVSYVVKGAYRDTFYDRAGRVTGFATTAPKPKEAFAREVASVDRRRKKAPKPVKGPKITKPRKPRPKIAKPARKPPKAPSKPAKPPKKPPKAKPPKKAKKPAKKPEKPKKTPLPQIFGKNRHEVLMPIKGEIKARILEAEALVRQAQERGHDATDLSEIGYEYYQLIAAVESMSPHDIYTLFKSPEL
jgi:hypothetical protein